MLEQKSSPSFNKSSITLSFGRDQGEAWMTILEKKLNTVREPLGDNVGFKIKSDKVKIPYADLHVTVSIRVWPSPRGSPKMVVEGAGYWPFILCVLPALIRKVRELKVTLSVGSSPGAAAATAKTPELPKHKDTINGSDDGDSPPNAADISPKVSEVLSKMEASVIDLGNILNTRMEKIEKKLEELTSSVPSLPSKQELAELGSNVAGLNKSIGVAVTDIRTSCQKVSEVTVKLDKPEVELLTKTVVEKIVPAIQKECSQNLERINSSIDIMNKTTEEAKDCINKTNAEQKELKESLTGLPKLVKTLQSIIDNQRLMSRYPLSHHSRAVQV